MEPIRSFIAIELPDELKRALGQLESQLKTAQFSSVKWVDPDSIHLTLKFLGNIDADQTEAITRVMAESARGIPPFRLEIKGLGAFPNLKRVQVVWVGITGEIDKIAQLQQNLESNLAHLGFTPEARSFTPHLTLARLRNQASPEERQRLGQLVASTSFQAGIIKVASISLMKSQLAREGAIYSRLRSVDLTKEGKL